MQQVPDGVLWGGEEVGGYATDGKVSTEMKAEVPGRDVAVQSGLEACNVGQGDRGVNFGLCGEGISDVGVQVAGKAGRVVVEGSGRERAAREGHANVDWCECGLVVGERARGDTATASAVRNGEIGTQSDGAGIVGQTVTGHGRSRAVKD